MRDQSFGDIRLVEESKKPLSMNPKKFGLWLFIASASMLFAAWTSAYIVRRAEGNWLYFELPDIFYLSTMVIVASSALFQWAYYEVLHNRMQKVKILIFSTATLGTLFLIFQFKAFQQLVDSNVYLVGNPSGSFIYIITGFHGLHIVSALIFLFIVINSVMKKRVSSQNLSQLEMCLTYWHYLGVLWVYLFLFFLLNR